MLDAWTTKGRLPVRDITTSGREWVDVSPRGFYCGWMWAIPQQHCCCFARKFPSVPVHMRRAALRRYLSLHRPVSQHHSKSRLTAVVYVSVENQHNASTAHACYTVLACGYGTDGNANSSCWYPATTVERSDAHANNCRYRSIIELLKCK